MRVLNLTRPRAAATQISGDARGDMMRRSGILAGAALLLAGCINVTAPEEPIVIELNVNIEARLLVELAEDASNTIEENADIF